MIFDWAKEAISNPSARPDPHHQCYPWEFQILYDERFSEH
jgi:hypothetical protein